MKNLRKGILYFDDTCRFCRAGVRKLRFILRAAHVDPRPFENGAEEVEMKLHWGRDHVVGGADAIFFLARQVWWLAPLGWLEWVPPIRKTFQILYRTIAAKRHCIGAEGTCQI